jgi:hypothetical protein
MGTGGSFPGGKAGGWGVKLTTHLHLVSRSKNEWSYTSTSPIRLHGVVLSSNAGTTLPLCVCVCVCVCVCMHATWPIHIILLNLITLTILGKVYILWSSSVCRIRRSFGADTYLLLIKVTNKIGARTPSNLSVGDTLDTQFECRLSCGCSGWAFFTFLQSPWANRGWVPSNMGLLSLKFLYTHYSWPNFLFYSTFAFETTLLNNLRINQYTVPVKHIPISC